MMWVIAMSFLMMTFGIMMTPYNHCYEFQTSSTWGITLKQWLVVYLWLIQAHFFKGVVEGTLVKWYQRGWIAFETKTKCKKALGVLQVVLNVAWQLLGNLVYYEQHGSEEQDKKFQACISERNPGYIYAVFVVLLLGYMYFLMYAMLACGLLAIHLNQRQQIQARNVTSAYILNQLRK